MMGVAFLMGLHGAGACAQQPETDEVLLERRLNDLESEAIQRRGQKQRVRDLLTRQDRRIADQQLRTLKTRQLRNPAIPRLERKFDRSARPAHPFDRR